MELLIDGNKGIYIPQLFAELYGDDILNKHELEDDLNEIQNPNNEYYWDAWDEILDKAKIQINGQEHTLRQDGDLWAVNEDDTNE